MCSCGKVLVFYRETHTIYLALPVNLPIGSPPLPSFSLAFVRGDALADTFIFFCDGQYLDICTIKAHTDVAKCVTDRANNVSRDNLGKSTISGNLGK
jgi:hypothetical protein